MEEVKRIIKEEEKFIQDNKAEASVEESEKIIEKRKENLINFFKNKETWVIAGLIVAIVLGVYIRSLPMLDHGGRPGLWDITTNSWTLGPDLDPWLFTRYAKILIEQGSLPKIDKMRSVPLGFDMSTETQLLPYMIAWTYEIVSIFYKANVEFSAALFPVIMFGLTIIPFFLLVREIFNDETKKERIKANIIALIATFFMIVSPSFLSRTVAGIPEKESAAFFFMFFAFYFFLKAWKSKKLKNSISLSILSGFSTAGMLLVWGGVSFVFITIAGATFIAFVLNKVGKKEFIIYACWVFVSFLLPMPFTSRISIFGFFVSLDTGLAFLIFLILFTHILLWKTKISNINYLKDNKIPKTVISLIISMIFIILAIVIFLGPGFIVDKLKAINQIFFTPVTGRWSVTVAENRQPYFVEWKDSFGPFIKNIPVFFWLFFIGSIFLFNKMLNKIKKKDAWILTALYVFFFCGLVFSRYAAHPNIFDGENFISRAFYYVSALLLIGSMAYFYFRYRKRGESGFDNISYGFLLLYTLFVLCLISARGAVRLIMVLAPIAPIFVAYLMVESFYLFKEAKDETLKIIFVALFLVVISLSLFSFWSQYNSIKSQAYSFIPSSYNYQWQKAMDWVRKETPKEAVFTHWWDYGYWVQSIGERATVVDGGNPIGYWNYLMGRVVLTGDSQKDALEFLYNHNVSYLLIDSTDIGKYTAFSSIGSNMDYDRYSWIGTFLQNEKQTQETKNQTIYVYMGGIAVDEDLIIEQEGKQILLPRQSAGIGAIFLPLNKNKNSTSFSQPYIIAVYQGAQYKIDLRYLYVNGQFIDFGKGIEACAYVFPRLTPQGNGVVSNPIGASMYISPRLLRGLLSQIYILDDPFGNFSNFKLAHTESSLIVDSLRSQGINLPEFIYYEGVQGPIKIWSVNYTGEEKIKAEYSDTDYTKYLNWTL
jgi:asparagine N-glycosylation enzyme membrane subunit Stt3